MVHPFHIPFPHGLTHSKVFRFLNPHRLRSSAAAPPGIPPRPRSGSRDSRICRKTPHGWSNSPSRGQRKTSLPLSGGPGISRMNCKHHFCSPSPVSLSTALHSRLWKSPCRFPHHLSVMMLWPALSPPGRHGMPVLRRAGLSLSMIQPFRRSSVLSSSSSSPAGIPLLP